MGRRHNEPNASHYSTRYAERKRAQQRARDLAMGPQPCLRCPVHQENGSLFCAEHAAEYGSLLARLETADDPVAAARACIEYAQRIYWP